MRRIIVFLLLLSVASCAFDLDGQGKCKKRPNVPKKYQCSQFLID